jgi:hypothetical protein
VGVSFSCLLTLLSLAGHIKPLNLIKTSSSQIEQCHHCKKITAVQAIHLFYTLFSWMTMHYDEKIT